MRLHLALRTGVAILAVGLCPSAASASSLTLEGDALVLHGDDAAEHLYVGLGADEYGHADPTKLRLQSGALTGAPAGCVAADAYGDHILSCPSPARLRVELGGGDDSVVFGADLPASLRVEALGGDGRDQLESPVGVAPALLDGGPGADVLTSRGADVLLGGDGDDDLQGRDFTDRLDGGAGNDLLAPDGNEPAAADVVDGGPGVDRIEHDWSDRTQPDRPDPPVTVTLAGGADDGRPGEGDDIRGVESVVTHQPSALVGTDAAEHLEAFQTNGPSTLTGNGGADELKGSGGPDTLDGGAGDDILDAGFGDDTITGGPGRDTIAADRAGGDCGPLWCTYPYGNDTVQARDGEADSITCGAGTDRVVADPVDTVAPDCEQVERGAATSPTPGTGSVIKGTKAKLTLRVAGHPRLATVLKRGLSVTLTGAKPGGKVTVRALRARRTVARGTGRVARTGRATVRLRFTPGAVRSLRRARSVSLVLVTGTTRRTVKVVR
jgi:RTX calcium-binding nonapeptide repeat (4 copies)